MKPQKEKRRIKDATISKIKFDKEWFYKLDNVVFYPPEGLSKVEFIFLPRISKSKQHFITCTVFNDIIRGRKEIKQ